MSERAHPQQFLLDAAARVGKDTGHLHRRPAYTEPQETGKLSVYHMPPLERAADHRVSWRVLVTTPERRDDRYAIVQVHLTLPAIEDWRQLEDKPVSLSADGVLYRGTIQTDYTREQLSYLCDYDGGAGLFVRWERSSPDGDKLFYRSLVLPKASVKDLVISL